MLFLAIFNYLPEDRDRVIERREEMIKTKGVEIKGEWFDVSGHRVFCLFEADDEVELAVAFYGWTDLGAVEVIPVMETDKALKLLRRMTRALGGDVD